jgi:hypothetical protein
MLPPPDVGRLLADREIGGDLSHRTATRPRNLTTELRRIPLRHRTGDPLGSEDRDHPVRRLHPTRGTSEAPDLPGRFSQPGWTCQRTRRDRRSPPVSWRDRHLRRSERYRHWPGRRQQPGAAQPGRQLLHGPAAQARARRRLRLRHPHVLTPLRSGRIRGTGRRRGDVLAAARPALDHAALRAGRVAAGQSRPWPLSSAPAAASSCH